MFKEIQKTLGVTPKEKPVNPTDITDVAKTMQFRRNMSAYMPMAIAGCDNNDAVTLVVASIGILESLAEIFADRGIDFEKLMEEHGQFHKLASAGELVQITTLLKGMLASQGLEQPKLPEKPAELG